MRHALLAAAAAALAGSAAPLAAEPAVGIGIPNAKTSVGTLPRAEFGVGRFHRDGRHDRRGRGRSDVVMDWYGGDWAYANNRSWAPDSFNDWWHDRPDRAFPRWVQHNENCAPERMWWSGGGWHC